MESVLPDEHFQPKFSECFGKWKTPHNFRMENMYSIYQFWQVPGALAWITFDSICPLKKSWKWNERIPVEIFTHRALDPVEFNVVCHSKHSLTSQNPGFHSRCNHKRMQKRIVKKTQAVKTKSNVNTNTSKLLRTFRTVQEGGNLDPVFSLPKHNRVW